MPTHHMSRGNECRIVLMGDSGVGKTAMAAQFMEGYFPQHHIETLLDCMTYTEEVDGVAYRVEIVDCTADKAFAAHRSPYIETADVIVLVYSMADKHTLHDLKHHVSEVVQVRHGGMSTIPMADMHREESASGDVMKENGGGSSEGGEGKGGGSLTSREVTTTTATVALANNQQRLPYRKEVPVFVVGTHADLVNTTQGKKAGSGGPKMKPVTREEAEKVTEECLHQIGLLPLSSPTAAGADNPKVASKIQSMWGSIRKKLDGDKKKATASPTAPHSPGTLAAMVPPGASPRLPLYELSVKNAKDVWQLFQAVVRLHVLMTEPLRVGSSTPCSPVSSLKLSACANGSSRNNEGGGTSPRPQQQQQQQQQHLRTLSTTSSSKYAGGGAGSTLERALTSQLPNVGSLYNLSMADQSFRKHERTLSGISVLSTSGAVAADCSPNKEEVAVQLATDTLSRGSSENHSVPPGKPLAVAGRATVVENGAKTKSTAAAAESPRQSLLPRELSSGKLGGTSARTTPRPLNSDKSNRDEKCFCDDTQSPLRAQKTEIPQAEDNQISTCAQPKSPRAGLSTENGPTSTCTSPREGSESKYVDGDVSMSSPPLSGRGGSARRLTSAWAGTPNADKVSVIPFSAEAGTTRQDSAEACVVESPLMPPSPQPLPMSHVTPQRGTDAHRHGDATSLNTTTICSPPQCFSTQVRAGRNDIADGGGGAFTAVECGNDQRPCGASVGGRLDLDDVASCAGEEDAVEVAAKAKASPTPTTASTTAAGRERAATPPPPPPSTSLTRGSTRVGSATPPPPPPPLPSSAVVTRAAGQRKRKAPVSRQEGNPGESTTPTFARSQKSEARQCTSSQCVVM